MANFRTFADHNGETVQLTGVFHDGHVSMKAPHFYGNAPDGSQVQASRRVQYKNNPSRHKCDARCMNAKGHKCECECGGKNHGAAA